MATRLLGPRPGHPAFACVTHRGNQVVAAMAINIMVAGLAPALALAWFEQGGQTPQLDSPHQRFMGLVWPWSQSARNHPSPGSPTPSSSAGHNDRSSILRGGGLEELRRKRSPGSSDQDAVRTPAPRFVEGENPLAVDTAGRPRRRLRDQASIISGVLCGVAGTYISTAASAGFVRDMTAGKGYLALAALIFGKWRPYPTLCACLLFAFADAGAARLQGVMLPVVGVVPVQFIIALPYILTVLLLAGFVGEGDRPEGDRRPVFQGEVVPAMNLKQRLKKHLGKTPWTSGVIFVAPSATVIGDVTLGAKSSVFYGAVLRGDIQSIRVGEGTNIQDNAVVHLADAHGVRIGAWCTIGHSAIIHACTIGDSCLIGRAWGTRRILDGSVIGARSLVGANSLVPTGDSTCPPGSLVYGSPAKVIRKLTKAEQKGLTKWALNIRFCGDGTCSPDKAVGQRRRGIFLGPGWAFQNAVRIIARLIGNCWF